MSEADLESDGTPTMALPKSARDSVRVVDLAIALLHAKEHLSEDGDAHAKNVAYQLSNINYDGFLLAKALMGEHVHVDPKLLKYRRTI